MARKSIRQRNAEQRVRVQTHMWNGPVSKVVVA